MDALSSSQFFLVTIIFVWSGFIRSAVGFGGAALTLPFLLLIANDPLFFLPIISIHLLFFSSLTIATSHLQNKGKNNGKIKSADNSGVDWVYLRKALLIMMVPKLLGVFGLITLPGSILSIIIFVIISVYALTYLLNKPFTSSNNATDIVMLGLGGYVSGTSLVGAPLIAAVCARHVSAAQLRNTLFAMWSVLVIIKIASFVYFDIDMQLEYQLYLLPGAMLGHWLGLKVHNVMQQKDPVIFYRWIGAVLLVTSLVGVLNETVFLQP